MEKVVLSSHTVEGFSKISQEKEFNKTICLNYGESFLVGLRKITFRKKHYKK